MPGKKRGPLISQRQTLSGRTCEAVAGGETSKQGASLAAPLPPSSSPARPSPSETPPRTEREGGRERVPAVHFYILHTTAATDGRTDDEESD